MLVLPAFVAAAAASTPTVTVTNTAVPVNWSTYAQVLMNGAGPTFTGTVTVKEGTTTLGSATMFAAGLFNVPVSFTTTGTHAVVAYYSGDANWLPAQSAVSNIQVVSTSVALSTTGPAGLVFGFHVAVTGVSNCAGTVSLNEGSKVLGTATLNGGSADFDAFSNPSISNGPHTITAVYSSTTPFCASASSVPLSVYVGEPTSTTQIVSITPNPSVFGQLPQALVRVAAAAGGGSGSVTVKQGSTQLAQGNLDASASVLLNLPSLPVGSWPLVAFYGGSPLGTVQASISAPVTLVVNPALVVVSAASGQETIAPDSLATVYGTNLAPTSQPAPSLPLPTELAGVQIAVSDADGQTLKAPLTFVSPGQVNFLLPPSAKTGTAVTISVSNAGQTLLGSASVSGVSPAIFTADNSGGGAPIAILVTAHGDGSQDSYPAYTCNSTGCVTAALDVASATDTNVLVLYATGIRNAPLQSVTALVDSVNAAVLFAGAQSVYPGLDQVNLQLPPSLAGRGEVVLSLTTAGIQANPVKLRLR